MAALERSGAVDLDRHVDRQAGAVSVANSFAIAAASVFGVIPASCAAAAEWTRRREACTRVATSASWWLTPWSAAERLAECLALGGVVDRGIERGLGHAHGAGPDAGAEQIEGAHRDPESVIDLAEDVIRGHAHVVEAQPADRVVGDERDRLTERPRLSRGTAKAVMPRAPAPGVVRAKTV